MAVNLALFNEKHLINLMPYRPFIPSNDQIWQALGFIK